MHFDSIADGMWFGTAVAVGVHQRAVDERLFGSAAIAVDLHGIAVDVWL
jgi:hypothetical protein